MLKNKIRKLLIKLGLAIFLTVSLFKVGNMLGNMNNTVYASSSNTYEVSDTIKTKEVKVTEKVIKEVKQVQNKGKILLYNSHGNEKNQDSTIAQITTDLKLKMEKKGYIVEQNLTNFATQNGYNKSYYSSGAWLQTLDLSQYVLCLDIHLDGTPNPINTTVKNQDVAKIMFPNLSENPNLKHQTEIVNKIKEGLESFSNKIYKPQSTSYRQGIIFYNLNKNPNMLLVEVGSDKNDFISCQRSLTYLSSAIDRALVK